MPDTLPYFDTALSANQFAMLRDIRRGVEKEGLRVQQSTAMLAQTPHPSALGSALTHEAITTDYSEALLEFITPVSTDIETCLNQLDQLHRFTAPRLDGELIWTASMPCIVNGERGIPIANFGSSNVGTMKRVYRNGLGARYGRMMQAIAGIHYNFSMPDAFWEAAWQAAGQPDTLADFKTNQYLGLIRNFWRRAWLLVYLLGASPAVCASFLAGNREHHLQPFDSAGNSLYLPHATSLRMGDLGYNSDAQKQMNVCYNSLETYIETLRAAIMTPHPPYAAFITTENGERAQLNDALLQIENEFYSPIRPKRVTRSGEAPLVALQRGGIEYVEIRCVDINPFLPLGIDATTIRIIDCFLLDCLRSSSPPCDETAREREKENLRRIVDHGRDPELQLFDESGRERPMRELANALLAEMQQCATMFDRSLNTEKSQQAIEVARARVADPEETPSGRLLAEMRDTGSAFWQVAQRYSRQWHDQFCGQPLEATTLAAMTQQATDSLQQQRVIESADDVDFDQYLAQFYAQYQSIAKHP